MIPHSAAKMIHLFEDETVAILHDSMTISVRLGLVPLTVNVKKRRFKLPHSRLFYWHAALNQIVVGGATMIVTANAYVCIKQWDIVHDSYRLFLPFAIAALTFFIYLHQHLLRHRSELVCAINAIIALSETFDGKPV